MTDDDTDTRKSETGETAETPEPRRDRPPQQADDPAIALLRAQSGRQGALDLELRATAKRHKISDKVIAKLMLHWLEPLWWGERGPLIHDFESFCKLGEKYPGSTSGFRLAYCTLGEKTRALLAYWLLERGVRVSPSYTGPPRCTTCGQVIRAGKRHGATA